MISPRERILPQTRPAPGALFLLFRTGRGGSPAAGTWRMGRWHRGLPGMRLHEGTIIAPSSNQRWASDVMEIASWNGEIVRIAFAIDTHDREIIAWIATTNGISGEMVRDLMLDCVERRFNTLRAPHPVQWLADNGSAYTARETIDFAAALLLVPCFTPVRSPESNGVCEAFVKTFKRDYARIQPRPDAITLLHCLPTWFEDYNDNHPHSGLRMRSPREFIRSLSQPAACPV
jgi:putative transposase